MKRRPELDEDFGRMLAWEIFPGQIVFEPMKGYVQKEPKWFKRGSDGRYVEVK